MEIPNLQQTIHRAQNYALSIQHADGYWNGEVDSNATMEAETLMLNYFLGINDTETQNKLAARILELQHEDGTWGKYYDGPGELSTTIECYFALKLIGTEYTHQMKLARDFIIAKGGVKKARVFTKIWLALFGQWPWHELPLLLPEIIFLPPWFPFNIYEFAVWARGVIVPLSIVLVKKPIIKINSSQSISELFNSVNSSPYTARSPDKGARATCPGKNSMLYRDGDISEINLLTVSNNKFKKTFSYKHLLKILFSWKTFFNCIDAVLKLYILLLY